MEKVVVIVILKKMSHRKSSSLFHFLICRTIKQDTVIPNTIEKKENTKCTEQQTLSKCTSYHWNI